jgi:molybdate transport system substrate-binding protein
MTQTLNFLSAGAAQALVKALQPLLTQQTGAASTGRFGAVGAMKEAFDAAEPCDMIILTEALIGAMEAAGTVRAGSARPLGRVRTGVAVRRGDARPEVGTPDALRAALLAADAIYFPDPERATAGIHFANVMRELGILDELRPRLRTFPNGATSMRELAAQGEARLIGCTQVTEILYTDGVELVGVLPPRFELATVYTGAVATRAAEPALAAQFLEILAGEESAALRLAGGFEF